MEIGPLLGIVVGVADVFQKVVSDAFVTIFYSGVNVKGCMWPIIVLSQRDL